MTLRLQRVGSRPVTRRPKWTRKRLSTAAQRPAQISPPRCAVSGVERVKVGIRLPLFDTELNLPSKPIEPGDQVHRKRQIGAQPRHRLVAAPEHEDAMPAFELDVEVEATPGYCERSSPTPLK